MILIDTSVWIDATNLKDSLQAKEVRALIDEDRAATTDFVIAEVLQGASSEAEFQELSDKMEGLHLFHADASSWLVAAELSFRLRRQGLATPLSDLVIGSVALNNGLSVYTTDAHFSRIPGLSLHEARP